VAVLLAATGAALGAHVDFVAPRNLSTVIGPTVVELRVAPPAGLEVVELVIDVDGAPLATLTAPPWRADWDAGDGDTGHRLEAVLRLSDGSERRAVVRTSALRINQVEEVDLVVLYAIARDRGGNYMTGLSEADFVILENGDPQTIDSFTPERRPLHVGIVLDTSLSMSQGGKLANAKKSALEFLDVLEPTDEGTVVAFNDEVDVLQTPTTDKRLLAGAIESTESRGGTALYDAVWRTAKQMRGFDGRQVMVLLSDGKDEASNGLEPGSLHTRTEALDRALRSEVMVFAIGLGRNFEDPPGSWERGVSGFPASTLGQILSRLSEETGGRALFTPSARQLRKSFKDIADDLRHQYSIAYVPTNRAKDGTWREIVVQTPGLNLEIMARKGYFAPTLSP
jgi:VWFA-related protein